MDIDFRTINDDTLTRLHALPEELGAVIIPAALREWGEEAHAAIMVRLSGPMDNVRSGRSMRSRNPGQYPVNVVTGHLRRNQKLLYPGYGASGAEDRVGFVNESDYAAVIHEDRPFQDDGIEEKADELDAIVFHMIEEALA
jgi:hypothetical protein